jgi:hypothetical protein
MEKKGTNVNTIRKRSYASKDEKHNRKAIRRPGSYSNFLKGTSDQAKTTNLPPPCTPGLRCDHSSRELTDCEHPIQLVQPVSSQLERTSNVIEHISMNCLFKRFSIFLFTDVNYINIFVLVLVEPELLAVLQEYEDKASNSSKKGYVNGSKRS